ncbi:TIGR01212 family radical SAM protein [Candidatus Dependentiae bacterium]|nr:TIGR01212 family radical SAM protein [Candidatus Dependentiae bacterium]
MEEKFYSFNKYLKNKFGCKVYRIPLNTGLSCPNKINGNTGCIYCDEFGSGASYYPKEIKSISDQVNFSMEMFSKKRKAKLFYVYFQSYSNTFGNTSTLKKMYDSSLIDDRIKGIIIGTRPDCINNEILDLISSYTKKYDVWIELGLQSSNNNTLKWLNRGHTSEDYLAAVLLCKKYNIKTTAHIIIGLPYESKYQMIETGKFAGISGIDGIKIHSLYIIKNTQLDKIYKQKKFNLLTAEEYSEIVVEILEYLPESIVIHRLTGETDSDRITAPDWVKNKNKVLEIIKNRIILLNSYQGKKLSAER